MVLTAEDLTAIWLTLKLAGLVTLILLIACTPVAWWLARTQSIWKAPINAIVAMPLVLPPSVLGFYLLIMLAPQGQIGQLLQQLGISSLPFSFTGLVVASLLYSLPFVMQPLQNAFANIPNARLDAAATLGASPLDAFFTVVLPLAKSGFLSATVLGFAHTVGEFGVVLMIGGNIPGETKVISVQIYDHVEALQYDQAHALSILMLGFAFVVLCLLYLLQRKQMPQARSIE
ncbi:molybdate ABC transporter permease subunit [Marinomonas sp. THO17]|uniref:molybdate ABC transporter permease subunit n=1 Tax=Marinomonas sp. THO17 TaxID=3149048 RepID=UPI00336BFCD7